MAISVLGLMGAFRGDKDPLRFLPGEPVGSSQMESPPAEEFIGHPSGRAIAPPAGLRARSRIEFRVEAPRRYPDRDLHYHAKNPQIMRFP